MGVWIVDPDWYYHTAAVVGRASSRLAGAVGTAADGLSYGHFMAGNEAIGSAWGSKYDAAAKNTVEGATALSHAWSALAGRIYQAGVNHAWAEFTAGRGKLPPPANLPPRPPISQISSPSPPSVGDNGVGLTDVLPGLVEAVGAPVPNADMGKLSTTGAAWAPLGTALTEAVQSVIAQVRRPDPSLPDATAFYSKLTSLSGPGEALSTDAVESGSLTEQFALANYGMRAGIAEEIYPAAADVQMSVTVNIQVTKVTGAAGVAISKNGYQATSASFWS